MFDKSVYAALNGCSETGLEQLLIEQVLPTGQIVRVFVDNFKQYRAVIFQSVALDSGYSGVLLNVDGSIRWMHTRPDMRGHNTTRQLCAFMTSVGVYWERSEHETTAGQGCYK